MMMAGSRVAPWSGRRCNAYSPTSGRGGSTSWSSTRSDRKSTRLNSSHSQISYAVFCLKKKKIDIQSPELVGVHARHLRLAHPPQLVAVCALGIVDRVELAEGPIVGLRAQAV